ncbi:hypothetical protein BS78_03G209400 [Paspalum vaginatum]|nr:hypothetical protein BS78_03G209400 [Paspalum vaginatum]
MDGSRTRTDRQTSIWKTDCQQCIDCSTATSESLLLRLSSTVLS